MVPFLIIILDLSWVPSNPQIRKHCCNIRFFLCISGIQYCLKNSLLENPFCFPFASAAYTQVVESIVYILLALHFMRTDEGLQNFKLWSHIQCLQKSFARPSHALYSASFTISDYINISSYHVQQLQIKLQHLKNSLSLDLHLY